MDSPPKHDHQIARDLEISTSTLPLNKIDFITEMSKN